jgi:hypothetical protein
MKREQTRKPSAAVEISAKSQDFSIPLYGYCIDIAILSAILCPPCKTVEFLWEQGTLKLGYLQK